LKQAAACGLFFWRLPGTHDVQARVSTWAGGGGMALQDLTQIAGIVSSVAVVVSLI
jgi:hypothetical protein